MSVNLILRTLTSPYGDTTKGSVLSNAELDNNFIGLKGEVIYSAQTSGNNVTLKKYNGNDINFNLTSFTDVFVTGGTYSSGTAIFTNNTGGTFSVSGFGTGSDIFVTGATYSNNTFTFSNNTGGTFNVLFNTVTGLTVNGNLIVTGDTSLQAFSATTGYMFSSGDTVLQIDGNQGTIMNVGNDTSGLIYNINTPSGFPIFDVYDDSTILMGSYLAPSLNTTAKITTTGTTNIYGIPTSGYTGAFFDYIISDGTNLRAGNIMAIWNGSVVNHTEITTNSIGNTSAVTFNVILSGGNAILQLTCASGTWVNKTIIRAI
jgi:hypothetical protein